MPDITIPQVDISKAAADLNNAVKEGAYVAVGLGVLGFQRAQVQRVELTKQLEEQLAQLNTQFENYLSTARTQAESARTQLSDQLAEISKAVDEALAPARARFSQVLPAELPTFSELTDQFEQVRAQVVELIKTVEERVAPARQQLDGQIDRIEQSLPPAARNVVQSIRSAASTQEHALRSVVGLN